MQELIFFKPIDMQVLIYIQVKQHLRVDILHSSRATCEIYHSTLIISIISPLHTKLQPTCWSLCRATYCALSRATIFWEVYISYKITNWNYKLAQTTVVDGDFAWDYWFPVRFTIFSPISFNLHKICRFDIILSIFIDISTCLKALKIVSCFFEIN